MKKSVEKDPNWWVIRRSRRANGKYSSYAYTHSDSAAGTSVCMYNRREMLRSSPSPVFKTAWNLGTRQDAVNIEQLPRFLNSV